MYTFIIILTFFLIITVLIYREYKNEKNYQKERKERHTVNKHKKTPLNQRIKYTSPQSLNKTTSKPLNEITQQKTDLQKKLDSAIKTVEIATIKKKRYQLKNKVRNVL